ncbi:MAG: 4-hydroxy-3-methylbut-2-enyl diphosphate reductase [Planctomycetes bacterium]|nr:4-hydroxy-3-methylbut-2-enyl diphosphate reductase [Planctomycetota bacterium]MCL4729673.1 4-hydroxy-3-methylbut-2-enyl diphosphate reductase [Planctomycetota bacterium]
MTGTRTTMGHNKYTGDLRAVTHYRAGNVEINIAKHSGYCWGVDRAYEQTVATAKSKDGPVFTFGPLIHNPQTIESLKNEFGVDYINSVEELTKPEGATVIIRTHGVPPEMQEQFKAKGAEVIDATCPYVRVTQNYAQLLHKQKYHVVIIGDPKHPEVISILAYAKGEGTVIQSMDDLHRIPKNKRRLGIVVQSTLILKKVNEIVNALLARAQEVRVFNTICYVTTERQEDAETIAKYNDHVIVIGGHASSNTKKLAIVAESYGAKAQLVESPEDIDFDELKDAKRIGILAGASTPNWLIDKARDALIAHFSGQPVTA